MPPYTDMRTYFWKDQIVQKVKEFWEVTIEIGARNATTTESYNTVDLVFWLYAALRWQSTRLVWKIKFFKMWKIRNFVKNNVYHGGRTDTT